jgi:2-octaprenyl-6-methoxyphenol hydroxylase
LAPANVAAIDQDDDAVRVTLGDGRVARTALVVGADGRGSFVREAARIRTRGWPYDHTAIVATITHTGSHQNTAIEHFLSTGPFAVLPFTADARGRYRSAVVWSERPVTAQKIMAMSDTQFAQALTARLPDRYGAVVAVAMRAAYPLSLQHAERYIDTRLALVADAAHGIHPIAGQGLNIGLRDAATLADGLVGVDDCGDDAVLAAYQRARRADVTTMVAATDGLTGLFGLGLPGLRGVRRLGMRVIDRLPPLKNALVRHAMGV